MLFTSEKEALFRKYSMWEISPNMIHSKKKKHVETRGSKDVKARGPKIAFLLDGPVVYAN